MAGNYVKGVKNHKMIVVSVAQPWIGLSRVQRIGHDATCIRATLRAARAFKEQNYKL